MNPFRQKRPVAAKPHDHLEEGRGAEHAAARRPPPAEYLDRSLRPLPSGRRHESMMPQSGAEKGTDLFSGACQVTVETSRVTRGEKAGQIFTLFCHAACLFARFRFRFADETEVEEFGLPEK